MIYPSFFLGQRGSGNPQPNARKPSRTTYPMYYRQHLNRSHLISIATSTRIKCSLLLAAAIWVVNNPRARTGLGAHRGLISLAPHPIPHDRRRRYIEAHSRPTTSARLSDPTMPVAQRGKNALNALDPPCDPLRP